MRRARAAAARRQTAPQLSQRCRSFGAIGEPRLAARSHACTRILTHRGPPHQAGHQLRHDRHLLLDHDHSRRLEVVERQVAVLFEISMDFDEVLLVLERLAAAERSAERLSGQRRRIAREWPRSEREEEGVHGVEMHTPT